MAKLSRRLEIVSFAAIVRGYAALVGNMEPEFGLAVGYQVVNEAGEKFLRSPTNSSTCSRIQLNR